MKEYRYQPNAWSLLRAFSMSMAILLPAFSWSQSDDQDDELEELEEFTVTGSRIKRLDNVTVNPVVLLDRESLDATGFSTVGDAIRSLPFNSGQSLVPADAGTSFTPGISTFNLRGLGNNNVLVLVNGRRAAPFGSSGFNGFQTLFDFNSLPSSAIESIEILKDGGSAIYGSDAVSGVVDIKLRRDYEGLNLNLSFGTSDEVSKQEKSIFVLAGTNSAKTSIVVSADWQTSERVFSRDLKWTRSADKRSRGGSDDRSSAGFPASVVPSYLPYQTADGTQIRYFETTTGAGEGAVTSGSLTLEDRVPNPAFVEGGTAPEFISTRPVYLRNFIINGGTLNNSGAVAPGTETFPGAPTDLPLTLNAIYPTFVTFPGPTANPTIDSAIQSLTRYDFLEDSDLFPEVHAYGIYTSFRHEISDSLYAFGEFSFRRLDIESQAAPTPVFSFNEQGDAPDGTVQIPASNPFNPFGTDISFQHRFRMVPVGNRINDLVADTPRLLVGLGGDIAPEKTDWTWELGVLWTSNTVSNNNPGTVSDIMLQEAYNGVSFTNEETGVAETLYLNPFGPSDERILDYLRINNPVESTYQVSTVDLSAGGTIADTPWGPVGVAVGFEYREEELDDRRSFLNISGNVVGGSEGSSVFGSRDVYAFFTEFSLPLGPMVELQVAGRHEDYSDFGSASKPKIALKFRPTDSVLLRASFGESFLAPNLPFLYSAQSTSFSSGFLADPLRPSDPPTQIKQLGGGNPDLGPEETTAYYFGATWEPSGKLQGFFASVEYFMFDSENLISRLSAQEVLRDFPNDPVFVTRRPPAPGETVGQIESISVQWQNLDSQTYEGLDLGVGYRWQTENLGEFRVRAEATYLLSYERDGSEQAGTWLRPEWRANFTTAWRKGDWSASAYISYIGPRDDGSQSGVDANGDPIGVNGIDYYRRQVLVNPQISYAGFFDSTITLGARNVFNSAPPFDNSDPIGYTVGVNDGSPRFIYLRFSRDY
jgi:iron complex outermembrane recepter protein